jgi:hypothetical protein
MELSMNTQTHIPTPIIGIADPVASAGIQPKA